MAIHRGVLHDILVDGARDAELRLGVTFESIENDDERVGVSFSDGGSCDYDVVLGADGARSAVRTAVCGDTILRPLDQMYWRVAINAPIVDQATMVFDDQRYVALMPLGGERTYLALQRRQSPVVVPADMRVASLRAGCEGLGGPVPYALDAVVADEDVFVGPAEEQVADRWDAGRIVLIGDAAHTLSPVLAQGGALALEDAVVLGEELGTSTDIDGALRAFLARRVPRVAALRDHTTRRIAMLNAGADQVDLAEATAALNTLLQQSI